MMDSSDFDRVVGTRRGAERASELTLRERLHLLLADVLARSANRRLADGEGFVEDSDPVRLEHELNELAEGHGLRARYLASPVQSAYRTMFELRADLGHEVAPAEPGPAVVAVLALTTDSLDDGGAMPGALRWELLVPVKN